MSANRQVDSPARVSDFPTIKHILLAFVAFFSTAIVAAFGADIPPSGADSFGPHERAVAAGLYWLIRHQAPAGNWSFKDFNKQCKDGICTGAGSQESFSAATALGVLPFLGAGQTQKPEGPFPKNVSSAINWLVAHQKPDGDLSAGAALQMYSHGIAAVALCEDYGMTRDKAVGDAAQKAIDFIENSQNQQTGGWRYRPGELGDTSVFGWQMTALRAAQLAGLNVKTATLDGAKKWLAPVSKKDRDGVASGEFSDTPDGVATPMMSAVGLLCNQYLQTPRTDPLIVGGVRYLKANQPDDKTRDVCYWFYATLAMHNMADKDWDAWHRKITKVLVYSQVYGGCADGSWNPEKPTADRWGAEGGRLMTTSFSCLTLEIYYRYLPIFKLDKPAEREQQK